MNGFYHFRRSTPLYKQDVVRMNRDTLYSMAVVDTTKSASITVPEVPDPKDEDEIALINIQQSATTSRPVPVTRHNSATRRWTISSSGSVVTNRQ